MKLRVTPEELGKVASKLSEFSKSYEDIYKQLLQQASTMGEAWEGEDNVAFVDQITGFTQELKAMADKLQLASDALKQQQTNYANTQETLTSSVKKLKN